MNNKILIKNGMVVFPDKILKRDIFISNNRIKEIKPYIKKDAVLIDAKNRYILPGGIDVHTHMDLKVANNYISSDDYRNGSRAALSGGITTFFGFAYQGKEFAEDAWEKENKKAKASCCDYRLHIGIRNVFNQFKKQVRNAVRKKHNTFKLHLNDPDVDSAFLLTVFRVLSRYNALAFLHCEDGKIIDFLTKELKKIKKVNIKNYPLIREDYTEKIAIDMAVGLARQFKTKIYIAHLSSKKGLETVSQAKKDGDIWIEAETCPHYLLFTDEIYKKKNGYLFTCSPSFKKNKDKEALWKGLKEGIINVISSDHCPFFKSRKEEGKKDFTKLPLGIPGIETLYPLMLSQGRKRKIPIQQIVKWISTNPAKIFNLYPLKGVIGKGAMADIVIYNPDSHYKISYKNLTTHCDYSPYEGMKVKGRIESVFLKGGLVVKNNELLI